MTDQEDGCHCPCRCLDDDPPNGGCRCLEDHCPCTLWEAEIWHTPMIRKVASDDAYGRVFAAACTCGWVTLVLRTDTDAWPVARRHARKANDELYAELKQEVLGEGQQPGTAAPGGRAGEAGRRDEGGEGAGSEPEERESVPGGPGATDAGQDQGDG